MEEKKEDMLPQDNEVAGTGIEEIAIRMEQLLDANEVPSREDADRLSAYYYRLTPSTDGQGDGTGDEATILRYMKILTRYKEVRAVQQERIREEIRRHTEEKGKLLDRMQELLSSTEDMSTIKHQFNTIREQWDALGEVDPTVKSEYLSRYSKLMEDFYELKNLTNEFRDLDFQKNKEIKEQLIAAAVKLSESDDPISAFNALQLLHDRWKETGPVAPDLRESMWKEFKDATVIVNKNHSSFFEKRRENEKKNLEKKTALCEKAEAVLNPLPTTGDQWKAAAALIESLREEWRTIGPVPKKDNTEIYKRFREATNSFFAQRRTSAKMFREKIDKHLEKYAQLLEQAEALKDSTDWIPTSQKLMDLQKEWKELGGLGIKSAEANRLWHAFQTACNHFFDNKQADLKDRNIKREANLKQKREIAAQMESLSKEELAPEELEEKITELQAEWSKVGLVPAKYKDEINDAFYSALRAAQAKTHKGDHGKGRPAGPRYSTPIEEMNTEAMAGEVRNLNTLLEKMEHELKQYENNLSFFNSSGSGKDALLAPVMKKIENLKREIERLTERRKALRSALKE
ncbi:MAG: DUF349 domain-containing protein [Porphyromonas sp.]|nr:DUF349 domain-containing protein [Porphyromonas sp.]